MRPSLPDLSPRLDLQHFVFGFHGHEASDDIKTLIKDYHLGCAACAASRPLRGLTWGRPMAAMSSCSNATSAVRRARRDLRLISRATHPRSTPSGFEQVHAITNELQSLARDAGHERPLMIGIDQENGEFHSVALVEVFVIWATCNMRAYHSILSSY